MSPAYGSIDECNDVASNLIKAGYKMNFYHKDAEVTKSDFGIGLLPLGPTLSDSAFHYHSGHGGDTGNANLPFNLQLLC